MKTDQIPSPETVTFNEGGIQNEFKKCLHEDIVISESHDSTVSRKVQFFPVTKFEEWKKYFAPKL